MTLLLGKFVYISVCDIEFLHYTQIRPSPKEDKVDKEEQPVRGTIGRPYERFVHVLADDVSYEIFCYTSYTNVVVRQCVT